MLFLEPWFWIFIAIAIPMYWLCPPRLKVYWLLLVSAVFHYHFAGPAGMAPIIVLAIATYFTAILLSAGRTPRLFGAACAAIIGALAFYKYSGFAVRIVAVLVQRTVASTPPWMTDWRAPAAPLAVSFFTFEFIHYLYEVRVHNRRPIRNPLHFAVFAIFFPTLASGPIKRFPDFAPQLAAPRNPRPADVWAAGQRIIRGLFKKICIADLSVEYINIFEASSHLTAATLALLAVLQGFRIYYDFSGYSDIAIGLAQMMGFRVPENFDRPYFSTTLQEFWRRWHMSLSSWIRDYIYIPLGGNRAHRAFNLLAAMVLCGLWHGAAFNFALWGLYHGAGLTIEAGVRRLRPGLFTNGWPQRILGWTICYSFVTYGWLLFFYPAEIVFAMTKEAVWSCVPS
ncbi:MAG TPA: MBOAT family O-acyltransferase [Candidatus Binatia bacterium]|nr:MBOAT family O-acyltransferase [Candidatus Binatia bacterium]